MWGPLLRQPFPHGRSGSPLPPSALQADPPRGSPGSRGRVLSLGAQTLPGEGQSGTRAGPRLCLVYLGELLGGDLGTRFHEGGGEEVSVSCRTAPVDGPSSEGTTDKGICAASFRQRPLPAPVGSGTPPRLAGHPHFPPGLCVLGASPEYS